MNIQWHHPIYSNFHMIYDKCQKTSCCLMIIIMASIQHTLITKDCSYISPYNSSRTFLYSNGQSDVQFTQLPMLDGHPITPALSKVPAFSVKLWGHTSSWGYKVHSRNETYAAVNADRRTFSMKPSAWGGVRWQRLPAGSKVASPAGNIHFSTGVHRI